MIGILFNATGKEILRIEEEGEISVGRDCMSSQEAQSFDDEYISRKHGFFTCGEEITYTDACSKNGSLINGEKTTPGIPVPLSDGDRICIGKTELVFRAIENDVRTCLVEGHECSVRNSAGGRKLKIVSKTRGCTDYQLRMIEENPQLSIADIIYVSSIDYDYYMFEIGNMLCLKDMAEKSKNTKMGAELIERILKLIHRGEECMLERRRYLISAETVFADDNGNLRLIYIPDDSETEDTFSESMGRLCGFLKKNGSRSEEQKSLENLEKLFCGSNYDTKDMIKKVYNYKEVEPETVHEKKEGRTLKKSLNIQTLVPVISFIVFMIMFWSKPMNAVETGAVILILTGINIVVYGICAKGEMNTGEKTGKLLRKFTR